MPTEPSHTTERKLTDEGLAGERAKADSALGASLAASEERADEILVQARATADDVLDAARALADARLEEPGVAAWDPTAIAAQRAREDEVVGEARAVADEALRRARVASLARLLPFERDKTDLYLLTERARSDASVTNRDDFLGMVAHDLRNLLSGIFGNAASLVADARDADRGSAWLKAAERIERAASRMNRLIGDLVDISSIDAGKLGVVPVMADLEGGVREAVETWAPPALAKGITLTWSSDGPLWAEVDHERILQVIGNLIANAVKFSGAGSTVAIRVEEHEGEARISVTDTGIGIPQEKLGVIFDRFCQVGKADHRGLGLGLYISKCLVEAHGGRIWAEVRPEGGSVFVFTLPGALRPTAAPSSSRRL